MFKTQRSFSVPTTKDPSNSGGIDEHQVSLICFVVFFFKRKIVLGNVTVVYQRIKLDDLVHCTLFYYCMVYLQTLQFRQQGYCWSVISLLVNSHKIAYDIFVLRTNRQTTLNSPDKFSRDFRKSLTSIWTFWTYLKHSYILAGGVVLPLNYLKIKIKKQRNGTSISLKVREWRCKIRVGFEPASVFSVITYHNPCNLDMAGFDNLAPRPVPWTFC